MTDLRSHGCLTIQSPPMSAAPLSQPAQPLSHQESQASPSRPSSAQPGHLHHETSDHVVLWKQSPGAHVNIGCLARHHVSHPEAVSTAAYIHFPPQELVALGVESQPAVLSPCTSERARPSCLGERKERFCGSTDWLPSRDENSDVIASSGV